MHGRRETAAGDHRRRDRRRGQGQGRIRRRQPQDRHRCSTAARDVAKNDIQRRQERGRRSFDSGQKKAAKEHADKTKPIDDSARHGRLVSASAWPPSPPTTASSSSTPKPPAPTRESYDKFDDPGDELFTRLARMETPLKLLEGLIIPKSMKGRPRGLGLHPLDPAAGRPRLGIGFEGESIGIGAAAVAGARPGASCSAPGWSSSPSPSSRRRYIPLMQSLADADGLTAYCRGLVDAAFKEERKRVAARRDEDLKRAEENYRKAFAAAEAQRDERLRKINEVYAERMVEVQTTQQRDLREALDAHDRRMAELRTSPRPASPKLDEKYKALKERIADRATRPRGARMADRWREGMKHGGGRARRRQPRGRRLLSRPGTTPPGPSARCPGSSRP